MNCITLITKLESDTKQTKPFMEMTKLDSIEPKPKMKIIEPNKDDKPNEEIDNSSDDYSDDNDSCYDQGMIANCEDEEDDESDDEDEKEPMVLKAYQGKKISAELTKKTPRF
ncbi:hypothetical protein GH714_011776 [Hevea brasiliensis]|uniref:Uncharacterized protein n=1 Tax=Hevea brasiliensis TaxID=3981 RepID=A0A6A6LNF8_HEVBR|nr:hypothetical protein GH714_011776 [Hevea brasiliensis]